MKAVQVLRHGRPAEVVSVTDIAPPDVGPGEVRVAVSAASLNFGDTARTRGGVATVMFKPPFTLGMDVCGVVEAAGAGGEAWLGRRVVGMTKMAFGGMAEQAIVPVSSVFDAPPELDDAEAAAFLLPFHVSYLALRVRARLNEEEFVLVTGAASGVGTAAVQVARAAGATVIAVAGGADKGRYCETLGAAASIDHHKDDIFDRVMTLTGGRGVDVAFNGDPQGGFTGKPLRKVSMGNFSVLGVMLAYGAAVGPMRRMGMNMFSTDTGREVHAALCDLVAKGRIRPAIGRRIRMEDVATTLEDHEARKTAGRTVVEIGRASEAAS
jgi:NADPH2:quinone reductase